MQMGSTTLSLHAAAGGGEIARLALNGYWLLCLKPQAPPSKIREVFVSRIAHIDEQRHQEIEQRHQEIAAASAASSRPPRGRRPPPIGEFRWAETIYWAGRVEGVELAF